MFTGIRKTEREIELKWKTIFFPHPKHCPHLQFVGNWAGGEKNLEKIWHWMARRRGFKTFKLPIKIKLDNESFNFDENLIQVLKEKGNDRVHFSFQEPGWDGSANEVLEENDLKKKSEIIIKSHKISSQFEPLSSFCSETPHTPKNLSSFLGSFSRLQNLSIKVKYKNADDTLDLSKLAVLKKLSMKGKDISPHHLKFLKLPQNIWHISLELDKIGNYNLPLPNGFLEVFQGLKKLRSLDIASILLYDYGFECLKKITTLCELSLRVPEINEELFESLSQFNGLKDLEIISPDAPFEQLKILGCHTLNLDSLKLAGNITITNFKEDDFAEILPLGKKSLKCQLNVKVEDLKKKIKYFKSNYSDNNGAECQDMNYIVTREGKIYFFTNESWDKREGHFKITKIDRYQTDPSPQENKDPKTFKSTLNKSLTSSPSAPRAEERFLKETQSCSLKPSDNYLLEFYGFSGNARQEIQNQCNQNWFKWGISRINEKFKVPPKGDRVAQALAEIDLKMMIESYELEKCPKSLIPMFASHLQGKVEEILFGVKEVLPETKKLDIYQPSHFSMPPLTFSKIDDQRFNTFATNDESNEFETLKRAIEQDRKNILHALKIDVSGLHPAQKAELHALRKA